MLRNRPVKSCWNPFGRSYVKPWNSTALSEPDVRWQQRFSNDCRALEQLEGFFVPPDLNAREE